MCLLGAAALASSGAFALPQPPHNCTPATGDNVTVTCINTTFDRGPGPNIGYGSTSGQNGVTINVQGGCLGDRYQLRHQRQQ